jgi:hypothetical protein
MHAHRLPGPPRGLLPRPPGPSPHATSSWRAAAASTPSTSARTKGCGSRRSAPCWSSVLRSMCAGEGSRGHRGGTPRGWSRTRTVRRSGRRGQVMPGRTPGGDVRDITCDGLTFLERAFEPHGCDVGTTEGEVGAGTIGARPRDDLPNRRPAQVEFVGRRRFVHHRAALRVRDGDPVPRRVVRRGRRPQADCWPRPPRRS